MRISKNEFIAIGVGIACVMALPVRAYGFEFPKTRAGEVAGAYIESFNSGDVATMQKFAAEYRSASALAKRAPEERAKRTMGLHNQMGVMEPAAVTAATEISITLTVRSTKMDMWLSCKFDIEDVAPHKLDGVTMMPTSAPDMRVETKPFDWENLSWKKLDDLLEQVRTHHRIPAIAAAVVENGETTDLAVVGVREVGADQAAERDDYFHIGSLGKSMTATMIGRLIELGKLKWDASVGDVLGDMDMHNGYRDATLEELLQHRAGFPGFLTFEDAEEVRLDAVEGTTTEKRAAFIKDVLTSEPIAPAGGAMNYSNGGYVVAAFMAEKITGQSWESLMQTHVFEPMNLRHSGFGMPATHSHPNQPRGHMQKDGAYAALPTEEDYPFDSFIAPAGNVYASIGDLANYTAAHLAGMRESDGALRAETFKRLHKLPANGTSDSGYAMGWFVVETDYGIAHTHGGSAGTFVAHAAIYPERNCAVVVAMNIGPEGLATIESIIEAIVPRITNAAN